MGLILIATADQPDLGGQESAPAMLATQASRRNIRREADQMADSATRSESFAAVTAKATGKVEQTIIEAEGVPRAYLGRRTVCA